MRGEAVDVGPAAERLAQLVAVSLGVPGALREQGLGPTAEEGLDGLIFEGRDLPVLEVGQDCLSRVGLGTGGDSPVEVAAYRAEKVRERGGRRGSNVVSADMLR